MRTILVSLAALFFFRSEAKGYNAVLDGFKYPHPVKYFEFTSQKQKMRMAYMDVATVPRPERVAVLLHGKNFAGYYWEPTIQFLTKAGFRVIVPDEIGFGKSSKPASYQFTFQALAENTFALLQSLKIEKASVVGHSMGGMLAARFTLMYPAFVSELVLVNPLGLEDWKAVVPYLSVDKIYAQELKATPDSIRAYQRESYFAGEWKPEYEPLVRATIGWTQNRDYSKVAWNSALTTDMIFTQPVIYEFQNIKVPTTLIIGQRDRTALGKTWAPKEIAATLGNYPVLGKNAQKLIPGSKLVEIAGVGHVPQVEAPEEYEKAVLEALK